MNILKLNKISSVANKFFPASYTLSDACEKPEGIMVRSFKMHDYAVPDTLLCVARAGAGVNNIPCDAYAQKGIVVFNTPGANANAVKELTLCAMFMCGRKIANGINWVQGLKGSADIGKQVEDGKKAFVGGEIMGKTMGVVGCGAIGSKVANATAALGMKVYGFDPHFEKAQARGLDSSVIPASIEEIFATCDFISLHVPYNESTKYMVNKDTIATMKDGVNIINCARGELVNNADIIEAVKSGKVNRYVTDFPCEEVLGVDGIIATPHIGASTPEAEDVCAEMAAKELVDYLDNGNIVNSVNFPKCTMPRSGKARLCVLFKGINNIAEVIANAGIKAENMATAMKGEYGYAIVEADGICECCAGKLASVEGVLKTRLI